MGGESSRSRVMGGGLVVDDLAVEVRESWLHHHCTVPVKDSPSHMFTLKGYGTLSLFKSPETQGHSQEQGQPPLEKYSLNLMKYRHPCMLRYVWHWNQKGTQYLATECVQPLSQVLSDQDPVQICIGLNQIAQALDFLHNNASLSHNNIGIGSVYVLPDGTWKLGGMELARPLKEMTHDYLKQINTYRYDKSVDPKEEQSSDLSTVDQYAFAQLVEDVFKTQNIDDLPRWQAFKDYCIKDLKNAITSQRPHFSTVLKHDFFNHEFISIHKFFVSLPVKTETEKSVFFDSLLDKLKGFNEEIVAKQLSGPLLSRLVLLDATAREKLLPHVLVPKQDLESSDSGLFSQEVFRRYITPHLLKMFSVRDVQVRLLLLKHFSGYFSTFSKEDLTTHILPELLLGIKDTSDSLVSMTLYCLADLVPILGAATVIGGKRSKLFADGRPLSHSRMKSETIPQKPNKQKRAIILDKIEEDISEVDRDYKKTAAVNIQRLPPPQNSKSPDATELNFGSRESVELEHSLFLHERPSPDGGEDLDNEPVINSGRSNMATNAEDDNWSDWETEDNSTDNFIVKISNLHVEENISDISFAVELNKVEESLNVQPQKPSRLDLQKASLDAKTKKLTDIAELDIKNQKCTSKNSSSKGKDEFDFFLDMEPVIEKASVLKIEQSLESNLNSDSNRETAFSSKLNFVPDEGEKSGNGGWGDNDDWDD